MRKSIKSDKLAIVKEMIDDIDVSDAPSSIIIDTKRTTGVPILSVEQRDEFLR